MFFNHVTPLDDAVKKGMLPPLETFACPYPSTQSRSGVIRIVFPEFTCVCPKTGYPDFASITLLYLPSTLCLELKSWKLYLNAFRMIGTFHETFCSHIYRELCTILNPQWLLLLGSFLPRGNVETVVLFESETPRPTGVDILLPRTVPNCSSLQPND